MCGRYYIDDETSKEIQKIIEELDKKSSAPRIKTGEIYPTDDVPILVGKSNGIEPDVLKWGFPNYKGSGIIINARAETASDKRMFGEHLLSRRCIVPASGFYEWNTNKEKIYFTPKEKSILYMAGIFDREQRFVIVTTDANTSISDVHDRMPLLLRKEQIEPWVYDSMQMKEILKQTPYLLNRSSEFEQLRLNL